MLHRNDCLDCAFHHTSVIAMLIITDSHISEGTPAETRFFALLDEISKSSEDVCFLGDIFELWLGLKQHETDLHHRFLSWCRSEKSRRNVYFIEGNHEYFVVKHHADAFTACSKNHLILGDLMLLHGDLLYGQNFPHRMFIWLSKSAISELIARSPIGKYLTKKIKHHFEIAAARRNTNGIILGHLTDQSKKALSRFHTEISQEYPQVHRVILGHFHCQYEIADDGDKPSITILRPTSLHSEGRTLPALCASVAVDIQNCNEPPK